MDSPRKRKKHLAIDFLTDLRRSSYWEEEALVWCGWVSTPKAEGSLPSNKSSPKILTKLISSRFGSGPCFSHLEASPNLNFLVSLESKI
jgi:hypothetical protein